MMEICSGCRENHRGSEDREHTSGGVFFAVDSNLRAVVGEEAGAVTSIPGNDGRITQAWSMCEEVCEFFSLYFWHSEGKLCWRQC